jgi:hypothetical protein
VSRSRLVQAFRGSARAELLAPYRTLALRVISLAVRDLITPGHSPTERDTARAFLAGSRMLTHWCKLADLDPDTIRKHIRGLAKQHEFVHSERRH